jgi:hypothetical protein
MPSTSKQQQRFFGLVKAIQEGKATGSSKAREAASSMSSKDVTDFASTPRKGLPEKKAALGLNSADAALLAALAGTSALGGLALSAGYGGAKELRDLSELDEIRKNKYRKRVQIPRSRKSIEEQPSEADKMLPEGKSEQSGLSGEEMEDMRNEDSLKQSSEDGIVDRWLTGPVLAGAAWPVAAIAPGIATYILGTRLVDMRRKQRIDDELKKAKREFEAALNEPSSKISSALDELAYSVKQAADGVRALPGLDPSVAVMKERPPVEASGLTNFPGNISYLLMGLPVGIGGLVGWKLMHESMKEDPERRKLKELNALLRRQTGEEVLHAGIDLEEQDGNVKFKL